VLVGNSIVHGRRLAVILFASASISLLAACGGDDEPSESEAPKETVATIDGQAFQDCILASAVDRGIYSEIESQPEFIQAAEDIGASFFEANGGDEGFVFFYTLDDPADAEEFSGTLEPLIADLGDALAEEFKGADLGEASVEIEGPVVLGFLPISEAETDFANQAVTDAADCIGEVKGSGA
jgi:hypothetical protein